MSRRDPSSEVVSSSYYTNVSSVQLIAGDASCAYELRKLDITPVGTAGSGTLSSNGVPLVTIPNDTAYVFPQSTELAIGSGLHLASSTPVNVTAWYVCWEEGGRITKSAARNATYIASLASPKAIRTPNRFGEQTEG